MKPGTASQIQHSRPAAWPLARDARRAGLFRGLEQETLLFSPPSPFVDQELVDAAHFREERLFSQKAKSCALNPRLALEVLADEGGS